MANLTKEYFDKKLGNLDGRLDGLEGRLDKKLTNLEKGLKSHIDKEVADLAGMVARRFDEIEKKLDVKEKVERLEVQMKKVWEALSL